MCLDKSLAACSCGFFAASIMQLRWKDIFYSKPCVKSFQSTLYCDLISQAESEATFGMGAFIVDTFLKAPIIFATIQTRSPPSIITFYVLGLERLN